MTPALYLIAAVAFVWWTAWVFTIGYAAGSAPPRTDFCDALDLARLVFRVGLLVLALLTFICWLAGGLA